MEQFYEILLYFRKPDHVEEEEQILLKLTKMNLIDNITKCFLASFVLCHTSMTKDKIDYTKLKHLVVTVGSEKDYCLPSPVPTFELALG